MHDMMEGHAVRILPAESLPTQMEIVVAKNIAWQEAEARRLMALRLRRERLDRINLRRAQLREQRRMERERRNAPVEAFIEDRLRAIVRLHGTPDEYEALVDALTHQCEEYDY